VDSGLIVEKLLEYMSFKAHYESAGPKDEVPVQEFMDRIPPEIVLELCVVAFLSFFVFVSPTSFVLSFCPTQVRANNSRIYPFRRLLAADYQNSTCLCPLLCGGVGFADRLGSVNCRLMSPQGYVVYMHMHAS
jgi:hypothetical protein